MPLPRETPRAVRRYTRHTFWRARPHSRRRPPMRRKWQIESPESRPLILGLLPSVAASCSAMRTPVDTESAPPIVGRPMSPSTSTRDSGARVLVAASTRTCLRACLARAFALPVPASLFRTSRAWLCMSVWGSLRLASTAVSAGRRVPGGMSAGGSWNWARRIMSRQPSRSGRTSCSPSTIAA